MSKNIFLNLYIKKVKLTNKKFYNIFNLNYQKIVYI